MNPNATNSEWVPSPFERLAATHAGGVTFLALDGSLADSLKPYARLDNQMSLATHHHSCSFATAGPFPLIKVTCEVTHFSGGVYVDYHVPLLPPMPVNLVRGFLKKFDEWTDRVLCTERERANFELDRAHVVTDGFFALFVQPTEAK